MINTELKPFVSCDTVIAQLPEKPLQRIKRITDTILSLSPSFFQLSSDEYADFMQLTKELHSANISILTDDNIE